MAFGLTKLFSKHGGRIIERWIFDAKSPLVCSGTVANLHNNDERQIVFGTKNGQVICVDEDGHELWTFGTQEPLSAVASFFVDEERVHSINAPPVAADINNDGKQEILVGNETGMLYCLNAAGKPLWKYECGSGIKASCLAADINSDGRPEVLVGTVSGSLLVLTHEGKKMFEFDTNAPVESVPGVYHGKKTMIVFGNNNGTVHCITPAQELLWRVELGSKVTAAPAFFSDPEEERMVIGNLAGDIVCVSEHGEIVWTYKTKGSIYGTAAIADLNNDHKPEIVVGSCDNNVYALNGLGRKLWSYETDFWITAAPIVADIDGDGKPEVIVGSFDHTVYVLDSQGSFVLDYMPGISDIVNQSGHYSNIMTSDPGEQTGKRLYSFKTNGIVVGCSLLERHRQKPALIINVKSGQVDDIEHTED
jgi:outer membrane protein assembly factor BamB